MIGNHCIVGLTENCAMLGGESKCGGHTVIPQVPNGCWQKGGWGITPLQYLKVSCSSWEKPMLKTARHAGEESKQN